MFDNRKQSVPERFIMKQNIDREVRSCYEGHVTRRENVVFVDNMRVFRDEYRELKGEQARLRLSCERFVKDQKANGPLA